MLFSFSILFHLKAPFIIESVFHKTGVEYGHIALCLGVGWFLGTTLSKNSAKFPIMEKVGFLLSLMVACGLLMAAITSFMPPNSWLMSLPVIAIMFIVGLCVSHLTPKALLLFTSHGGAANACYFAGMWLISGAISGIYSKIYIRQPFTLSVTYIAMSIISLLFFLFLVKSKIQKSAASKVRK